MARDVSWRWEFRTYRSSAEGAVVQDWFDGLPVEVQDEISDAIRYLSTMTSSPWDRPTFDMLMGEPDISELRIDVQTDKEQESYRIYGYFGPIPRQYTLLHGTLKPERNDRNGKRTANERLRSLRSNRAGTDPFYTSPKSPRAPQAQPRSQAKVLRFDRKQGIVDSTSAAPSKNGVEPT